MAAARRFAEAGTKLILVARRGERLDALKAELQTQYKVLAQAFVASLGSPTLSSALPLPELLRWLRCWLTDNVYVCSSVYGTTKTPLFISLDEAAATG